MKRLRVVLATAAVLPCLLAGGVEARPPDHLDGIPDDTLLFITGPGLLGYWGLSRTQLPPDPFYSGDWLSGGYVGFNFDYLDPHPNRTLVGDFTGDGVDDLVVEGHFPDWAEFFVGQPTPVDNGVGTLGALPLRWRGVAQTAFGFFLADVNGDGLADLITVGDGTDGSGYGWMHWEATYLPPDDGTPENNWDNVVATGTFDWGEVYYDAHNGTTRSLVRPLVGDFNGDGRADVGRRWPSDADAAGGYITLYLTAPDGFDQGALGIEDVVQGSVSNFVDNGVPANVATLIGDLDGDGKDDVVEVEDREHNGSFLFVAGLTAECGAESGLCIAANGISWAAPFGQPPADATVNVPLLADLNGDGRDDLVVYRELLVRDESGALIPELMNGQWHVSFTQPGGSLFDSPAPEMGQFWFPADWAPLRPLVGQFRQCPVIPCCPVPFADADRDGDVDQADFARFQECYTGPAGGIAAGCECFDRDNGGTGNGVIDEQDLFRFERCASGPWIAADPACEAELPAAAS